MAIKWTTWKVGAAAGGAYTAFAGTRMLIIGYTSDLPPGHDPLAIGVELLTGFMLMAIVVGAAYFFHTRKKK